MSRPRFIPGSTVSIHVKNRAGKKSLASYLAARLGVVEPWALDLLENGCVSLDDQPAGTDSVINLSAGPHHIGITFPEAWPRHMAATEMPLDILYEDEWLLVLNKPPGRVVHPARGHLDNQTLQNGVRYRYRHLLGREDITIGSPHRLDKDTSGAIVFAISRTVYAALVEQFSSGKPHKEYLAVLDGNPEWDDASCRLAIGRDPDRTGLGKPVPEEEGGKPSRTDFRILERGNGWALASAIPFTGRPHQIRVHAASLGVSLAGDRDYNPRHGRLGVPRQALHAAALTFRHPVMGTDLHVEAGLTDDIRNALAALRARDAAKENA